MLRTEKEKSDISGSVEVREMGIEDLKDDRVVLRGSEGFGGLEIGADGRFIRQLGEVMKRHQREVKLAIGVGGAIVAVILASERLKNKEDKI